MIKLLKRFFEDFHELRIYLTLRPESHCRYIELSMQDRDLLTNYRRNKPRVKKEAA